MVRRSYVLILWSVCRVKTEGDPSSKDGNTTTDGPALPWEQSAQMQG